MILKERNRSTVPTLTATRYSPGVTSSPATRELTRGRRSLSAPPALELSSGPTTSSNTSRDIRRKKLNRPRNP